MVNTFLTSTPGSFPFKSKKLCVIGQGIDEEIFRFNLQLTKNRSKGIHIGRFDPAKNNLLLINTIMSMRVEHPNLQLTIVGNASNSKSEVQKENIISSHLRKQGDWLNFQPSITRDKIPMLLSKHDFFIHGVEGSLDKILIDCTLLGIPVITINPEYIRIFGSWNLAIGNSPSSLDGELVNYLNLSDHTLEKEIVRRYDVALKSHTLNQWISQLITHL
jgi:hypothetical protein